MTKANNFDLIRLAAALQVAVTHSIAFFLPDSRGSVLLYVAELFPGVPVFFFVSGFLISASYEKNSSLGDFARNRALRIYPGLAVCFAVSLALVWLSGYFTGQRVPTIQWLSWSLAQLSIGQFFNPDFMRHYGTGVLNGSMWTVTVELQFYVLIPLLYAVLRRRAGANRLLLALIFLFAVLNQAFVTGARHHSHELWFKLVGVSFIPWFYMFLVGVLCQRNARRVGSWLAGRLPLVLLVYGLAAVPGNLLWGWNLGNLLSVPLFLALAALVFSAALTRPNLSDQLLRRNDISYGVYIYHMPVANFLLATRFGATLSGFLLQIVGTLACATVSWICVEKPALALKRHALYRHDEPIATRSGLVSS
ncbi:MAG TPA: acyltransferase [Steroidobacteraceae bacterium]|nr:acyltransferase [Steroidobacteraceae bacterium]